MLFSDNAWEIRYNGLSKMTEKTFSAAAKKAVKALDGKSFKYSKSLTVHMSASYSSNTLTMKWYCDDGASAWIEIYFDEEHQFEEDGFVLKAGMKRKATKSLTDDDVCVTTSIAIGQTQYTMKNDFMEVTSQDVIIDLLRFPESEDCINKLYNGTLNLLVCSVKNGWSPSEGYFFKSGEYGSKVQTQFKKFWKAISGDTFLENRQIAQICLEHMNDDATPTASQLESDVANPESTNV